MEWSTSPIERFITRPRPIWLRLLISLALLLLPFGAAYLDHVWEAFLQTGEWHVMILAPVIVLYIWFVSPVLTRGEADVVRAMRPLVPLDDDGFSELVQREAHIHPRVEWLTLLIGALIGWFVARSSGFERQASWLAYYWFASMALMYALLAWVILGSWISTRLNRAFHLLPLRIDVFDPTPFEAIGRQSLRLALVFIGGITLSYLVTFQARDISSPSFWWQYILMVAIVLVVFFFSMRPTQRVLSTAKKRELKPLQRHINRASRELMERLEKNKDPGSLPDQINALAIYEQRLLAARTWPYNTDMLRTLVFSVFIPLGSVVARLLIEIFLR